MEMESSHVEIPMSKSLFHLASSCKRVRNSACHHAPALPVQMHTNHVPTKSILFSNDGMVSVHIQN